MVLVVVVVVASYGRMVVGWARGCVDAWIGGNATGADCNVGGRWSVDAGWNINATPA